MTPLGRGVVVVGAVAGFLAMRFNWQEFTQLAFLAVGLVLLALLWQVLPGAPSGELVLAQRRSVAGGATPSVEMSVHTGMIPMLFPRVVVPAGGSSTSVRLPFLRPFSEHTRVVELPALPRGAHQVGPLTYEKTDPVGIMSRRLATGASHELLVSPPVTELAVFAGGMSNAFDGATSQQRSMSDLAFHALREYVRGDDLRHVHWRSSAKAGELLVRQFHETRRGHVTVLLDASRSSYPRVQDFELAVSAAASIALRSVRDDFDTYLRCGAQVAHTREAPAMTDVTCRFELQDDDNYLAQAVKAADESSGTGLVVQVTGASRGLVDLDEAAAPFGRGAAWIVVRADSEGEARVRDTGALRELSVSDLVQLQALLARGMR